jgi:molybdopterin-containing oxidoreductase family iron-sulfur binding subunit
MDKKRRDFLKAAGITTVAGLGAPTVLGRLLAPGEALAAKTAEHGESAHGGGHGQEAGGHGQGQEEVKSGNRFGMVIDLNKFQADKSLGDKVMQACHSTHNVPNFPDKKDEVKWIWMTEYSGAFTEHSHYYKDQVTHDNPVPVLCNHCDKPPCVRACPTKATYRTKDGIVAMDYHRCIGCRFCMAACPYGSRSFNWRDPRTAIENYNREFPSRMRGVVEKCNFCVERVLIGGQPACVEACGDSKAMVFGNLNDPHSEIRKVLKENYTIQRKPSLGTYPSVFYIV